MPPASGGCAVFARRQAARTEVAIARRLSVLGTTMSSMTSTIPVRRLRLAAQHIDGRGFDRPVDVVRWMLALQGQDLPGVKWSVGLRAPGTTLADVDAALDRGEIIRSWPMRGTLHLVAAEDIGWVLDVTAARTVRSQSTRHRQLGLDDMTVGRAGDVAIGELEGGRAVTRTELFSAFERAGIDTSGQRGPHLLGRLHQSRLLCLGPMRGTDQAIVLLAEWVPQPRSLDRDEALGEFVRRYFSSHGPATLRDFAWWTKLPLRDAKIGLAVAGHHLEQVDIDDTAYWMAPGLTAAPPRRGRLLPGFDEFLLGYQDRGASLAPAYAQLIVPGGNGVFQPTVVVDGRVVGTWRRRRTATGATVTMVPFEPIPVRAMAELNKVVAAYGQFLGVPVGLTASSDVASAGAVGPGDR